MASQKSKRYGVDPVSLSEDQSFEAPYCPHGPTLMFERFYPDKQSRKFFACAVHRDRKGCPFFVWADETLTEEKRERWKALFVEEQSLFNCEELWKKYSVVRTLPPGRRYHCPRCGVLLLDSDLAEHEGHDSRRGVSDEELAIPTCLVTPRDNKKSQAQFYFSDSSLQLLCSELTRLKYSHILCVGTPRLHEQLMTVVGVSSLLLDIDHRYAQFYSPDYFQRFNMFNCFFYSSAGEAVCRKFLEQTASGKTAIVIDPPFGGLAEVLAQGLRQLWDMAEEEVGTFLVFPYFMESHVISALPSLWMMDYQITYENHRHFTGAKPKRPSPVRIYTNLPQPGLQLPPGEGYRICELCNKYVSKDNVHCDICGSCPSKDGRQYRHCDACKTCVKPGRVHCSICQKCDLPQHSCLSSQKAAPVAGCHVCGSLEHKRRDCPEKAAPTPAKRRKTTVSKRKKPRKKQHKSQD